MGVPALRNNPRGDLEAGRLRAGGRRAVRLELAGAIPEETDFGADVSLEFLLPAGEAEKLNARLRELSGGSMEALVLGEEFRGVPLAMEPEEG